MDRLKLYVKAVFIDIDGTLTTSTGKTSCSGPLPENPYISILAWLMGNKTGISEKEAVEYIQSNLTGNTCIFTICQKMGLDTEEYWNHIVNFCRDDLKLFEDGVYMVKELSKMGFRLYTATTNSRMITLAKLHICGLADVNGSKYFEDFFGGDSNSEYKKFEPEFFKNILDRTGIYSRNAVMIGDNPVADWRSPYKAGIRHSILVDRSQKKDVEYFGEKLFVVNSLYQVPKLLDTKK